MSYLFKAFRACLTCYINAMLFLLLSEWERGFISHSSTHLYFSGVVAVNWGRIYILSARSMTSCPLPIGHGFGHSLVGRIFMWWWKDMRYCSRPVRTGVSWPTVGWVKLSSFWVSVEGHFQGHQGWARTWFCREKKPTTVLNQTAIFPLSPTDTILNINYDSLMMEIMNK